MTHKLYTLVALASFIMVTPTLAEDMPSAKVQSTYQANDNGGYEKSDKTTTTDANGTTITHTASKKVDVDSHGNATTKVDIKDKKDPKGIFSKSSTTEMQNTSSDKNGEIETTHVKTVNGTTVEKSDNVVKQ